MLVFQLQWPQFFAIAVANFLLGWLWYSPVAPWFKAWAKAAGLNPDPKKMSKAEKERMPLLFGGAILSSFLLSYGLQVLVHSINAQGFGSGALLGLLLWTLLPVPVLLGSLWEGRKTVLVQINLGNYLFICVVFSGILAAWR